MRDLVFLLCFIVIFYFCIRRPFIGIAMWLWVAMFYPKGWVFGFAGGIRYNLLIAGVTMLGYFLMSDKPKTRWDLTSWLILIFLCWTCLTSATTLSIPALVWADWIEFLKICMLYFFAIAIIRTDNHINTVVWAIALSIGSYACIEGLKYILSGGGHILEGMPGHILGDRNDLAVGINMTIPLVAYLLFITQHKLVRLALMATILLCILSVLGSNSRGGFIGLAVIGLYFWFQSKQKLMYSLLLGAIIVVGLNFMPEEWYQRMSTIDNAKDDLSFLGRVMAWKQAVAIASDNFTGGGFKAGQFQPVWDYYDPRFHYNHIIDTSHIVFPQAKAAHSIYFQVLGDHGYVGFILFMSICGLTFLRARRLRRQLYRQDKQHPMAYLSAMVLVALVSYLVSGAAVSLAYFDLLYIIIALVYVIEFKVVKPTPGQALAGIHGTRNRAQ